MGLASSQARLLTLTSRQHTIEANAQRLLSDKMRLSNDSDAVYQKYMNVLDDTTLKTRQTDDNGDTFWIDGNIKNLMRWEAPEDTGGSVFFVQDLDTKKLYVPQEIADSYANLTAVTVPADHTYTDAMKFAVANGITYKKVDHNEDLLINYNTAIKNGYNTALTEAQYNEYTQTLNLDDATHSTISKLLGKIPEKDGGIYKVDETSNNIYENYIELVKQILSDPANVISSSLEKNILWGTVSMLETMSSPKPEDIDEYRMEPDVYCDVEHHYEYRSITHNITVSKGGTKYIDVNSDDKFDSNRKFEAMLNGGTMTWDGEYSEMYSYIDSNGQPNFSEYSNRRTETCDVYDSTMSGYLSSYGSSSLGDALTRIFTDANNRNATTSAYLARIGKTETDAKNYILFKKYELAYQSYYPDIEYIPNDRSKDTIYQTIYNAITAAGGYTVVNDETAKNASWVQNMIKNAKVILTAYDDENKILSKTTPSLHVDIKEISDKHLVEQAEQDYEVKMSLINAKETDIDNLLSKLESERTAITTEVDGIKSVMKDNVSVNFKLFG